MTRKMPNNVLEDDMLQYFKPKYQKRARKPYMHNMNIYAVDIESSLMQLNVINGKTVSLAQPLLWWKQFSRHQ